MSVAEIFSITVLAIWYFCQKVGLWFLIGAAALCFAAGGVAVMEGGEFWSAFGLTAYWCLIATLVTAGVFTVYVVIKEWIFWVW